ncbi:presequence protease, mitochondrial isoform X1 [Anabrus simplex]|uniref:presequence protease, mitochondrial isoform X1 n=1 Tax=Anabrus simplex TaxID=316456 RepID=UPI0035A383BD
MWKLSHSPVMRCRRTPSVISKHLVHILRSSSTSKLTPLVEPKESVEISSTDFHKTQKLNVGNELEGFVVEQVSEVPEFHLTAARLKHLATGAEYLHIYRDDSNNAFSVGFRTTPQDSTGLPHILEHTTLCGSLRYPCRDPFFKMLNRSMATFMNAMTGPDYTIYPFSTQNPQDYNNLMSVYLDAVFKPQLRESDFRQEGWRLEHEDVNDPNSPIIFKGVVYNEMKGVFSDNQSLFGQQLLNSLLPGHTYGHVSGGDPAVIPKLTYEDLKAFHAKFYNPSNSRFYSYGNFPLADHLIYINQNYLSNFNPALLESGKDTAVPPEIRWTSECRKHIACRFDPLAANPQKQSTLAISQLCTGITDIQGTFELQVLSELLVRGPNSAFYKTLVEPNIGAGFAPITGYESQTRDTFFTVGLQGLNPVDFDRVIEIYNSTIDSVIEKGFEKEHIEAILHGIELSVRHQSADFGLGLLFGITPLWNHDGDIIQALHANNQVSQLRRNMKENPKYLQQLVEKYFKGNPHKLTLSMSPEEDYDEKQSQAQKLLLQSKLSNLSEDDRRKLFVQGKELLDEQQKVQDTSCLPTLHIDDLKKEIDQTPLRDSVHGQIPVQVCMQPTNGITYFRGIINTSAANEDLKLLIPLFNRVVAKMGTKKRDYRAMDQLIQLKTGGVGFSIHYTEDTEDISLLEEGIAFTSHCLDRNVQDMFGVFTELFSDVTLNDLKRFETLVRMSAAQLVNGITDSGHHYAVSCAGGLVSSSLRQKEMAGGLSHVGKMREIAQMSDLSPVLNQMQEIASLVLNKKHMRCAINLSHENEADILKKIEVFFSSLPGSVEKSFIQTKVAGKVSVPAAVHHVLPIPVNFTAKSLCAVSYRHPDFAPLRILARLLSSKYLHPLVREKGGAYGAGANVSASGVFNFYSYRDPGSTATFDVYDGSEAWVAKNSFTKQDIEEAKLGVFQHVDAPVPPGSKGLTRFLYGIDDVLLQKQREALMAVTRDDILRVAHQYLSEKAKCGRALIGPENKELVSSRTNENWEVIIQE